MLVYVNEFFFEPLEDGLDCVKSAIKSWLDHKIGPAFSGTRIIPFDHPFTHRHERTGMNEVTIIGTPDRAEDYCLSINYRHNDAAVNGRAWYTRIGIERLRLANLLRATVLLETSEVSPQAAVEPVIPSMPGIVHELLKRCQLSDRTAGARVRPLTVSDVDAFEAEINNPERFHNLIVVSPDDFSEQPNVDPRKLQSLVVGLAQVFAIPQKREAWKLRDRLPHYHTAWDGSISMIGASRDGRAPARIFRDAQIDAIVAETERSFERYLFAELTHRYNLPKSRRHISDEFVSRRLTTYNLNQIRQELAGASGLEEIVRSYEEDRDKAQRHAEKLELELLTAEAAKEELQAQVESLDRDRRTLHFQLKRAKAARSTAGKDEADATVTPPPDNLPELADWIEEEFSDQLVLINHARKTLRDSPFEEPARVAETFKILAGEFFAAFSGDLRMPDAVAALQSVKGRYSGNQSEVTAGLNDGYVRWHNERKYELHKHIGLGNARDPRHCFRLYFEWEPTESRIIVLHAGEHLATQST